LWTTNWHLLVDSRWTEHVPQAVDQRHPQRMTAAALGLHRHSSVQDDDPSRRTEQDLELRELLGDV